MTKTLQSLKTKKNNKRYGRYRMKLDLRNKTLFEKSSILTSFLQERVNDLKIEEIVLSLGHIAKHHYGYRKEPLAENYVFSDKNRKKFDISGKSYDFL